MEMIKKYQIDGGSSEVFAISLVEEPAIESDWIALAKEKRQIMLKDEKKRMLYGCVLRADFPIYRYNPTYGEYFLQFSKDAIEKIQKKYMQDGLLQSFTIDHEEDASGLYVTESWIKESEEFDKSRALGIGDDCAVGSWFAGVYVDSNDIWKKIEAGGWNGFSIEGMIAIAEEEIFSKQTPKEEKLEEVAPAPVPEPVVEQPVEPVVEQTPSPEPPPVPTEETPTPESAVVEEAKPQDNDITEVIKSLKAEIAALKDLNHSLTDKVKDLSTQPSAKPVNVFPNNGGSASNYTDWRNQMRNMLR